MKNIRLGRHIIGEEQPTYIIAEIGINHNGDENRAAQLIEAAAAAGVNAVKFQKRHLPSLYPPEVLESPEKFEQTFQYMIPLLKEVELREESFGRLKKQCDAHGLDFLCTPFDPKSADFLHGLGVNGFKIASADLTNLELMEHVTSFGKPLIVSTGMSLWEEIEAAVSHLRRCNAQFALLHCRSVYPVWPREVNLRMINRLRQFDCPVGYSGHEVGIVIPLVAASMGASIIEKHITLDKNLRGPDHKVSLDPYEFKRLVRDIRVADQAVGKGRRYLLRGEVLNRELFGKSLVANREIPVGTIISRDMVMTRGPGKGLSPLKMTDLIGTPAKRTISQFDFFQEADLVNGSSAGEFTNSFRSQWGLIARFTDAEAMLAHAPKVLEFHLAEKDFSLTPHFNGGYPCRLVVHAPEYMGDELHDLASLDEAVRARSVQATIKTIVLTRQIAPYFQGKPKLITHPGAMSLNQKLDPAQLEASLVRSVQEILPAVGDDMEFLLENLPPYPWYFGGQWKGNYFMAADEIADFCSRQRINICFDLSHAALYCNAKDVALDAYIRTVLPLIRHIHFADAYGLDGEGMQIGEGDIDLDRIMPLFADYRGTWVPEVWRGHLENGQGFLTALERLKSYPL
ncbi:MAG: N-acetylneuraminate synthase family protein [Thermodesulfobacteriota bacterium]